MTSSLHSIKLRLGTYFVPQGKLVEYPSLEEEVDCVDDLWRRRERQVSGHMLNACSFPQSKLIKCSIIQFTASQDGNAFLKYAEIYRNIPLIMSNIIAGCVTYHRQHVLSLLGVLYCC